MAYNEYNNIHHTKANEKGIIECAPAERRTAERRRSREKNISRLCRLARRLKGRADSRVRRGIYCLAALGGIAPRRFPACGHAGICGSEDGAADARCAHRKRQAVLQTLFPDIIFDIPRRRRCRMCAFIRRRCGDRY